MDYKRRFADQLERLEYEYGPHRKALEPRSEYDAEAAGAARVRLVERLRRIETTAPGDLPYDEFLDSPYWLELSQWLKWIGEYICEGCGQCLYKGLEVHHKTYAHRGDEYPDHLDDLEVLCRDCHQRRHPETGGLK